MNSINNIRNINSSKCFICARTLTPLGIYPLKMNNFSHRWQSVGCQAPFDSTKHKLTSISLSMKRSLYFVITTAGTRMPRHPPWSEVEPGRTESSSRSINKITTSADFPYLIRNARNVSSRTSGTHSYRLK